MEEILASIRRIISSESNTRKSSEKVDPFVDDRPRGPLPAASSAREHENSGMPGIARAGALSALQSPAQSPQSPTQALRQSPVSAPVSAPAGSFAELANKVKSGTLQSQSVEPKQAASIPALQSLQPSGTSSPSPATLSALAADMKVQLKQENAVAETPSSPVNALPVADVSLKDIVNKLNKVAGQDASENFKAARAELSASKIADTMRSIKHEAKEADEERPLEGAVGDQVSAMPPIKKEIEFAQAFSDKAVDVEVEPLVHDASADQDVAEADAFKEALVAPSTQMAVTSSLDRLRSTVENIDAAQVESILRPMLKEWLDSNLPTMVEKMVQEEISRITSKK